jgi:uncharacterized membrane-anchored protein
MRPIDRLMQTAIGEGLLPPGTACPLPESRPWPVVMLTALGAWLAALPLLGVVGLLFGDWMARTGGLYVVGLLVLAGAVVVLRSSHVPLFVEQLAVPALLVGGGSLGFGLFRDLPAPAGAALLALVAVGVALAVARPWLRVLLGAAAAILLAVACMPAHWSAPQATLLVRAWWAWHLVLAAWLVAGALQHRFLDDGARAAWAAGVESLRAGMLLATLAGLAVWSGMTFMLGASLGAGFASDVTRELAAHARGAPAAAALAWMSTGLGAAAAVWAASRWSALRRPSIGAVALVLAALSWFMPALGGVWLALAVCVTQSRWRLAASAAFAAAWIIGAFYYQLDVPLALKSIVLMAGGGMLGLLGWIAVRAAAPAPSRRAGPQAATRGSRAAIGLSALAVLVVANLGIWQKEHLIANGQPVFVELAPADPRSLMQGDFMRLNFRLPGDLPARDAVLPGAQRPRVIGRRDDRGVARLVRLDTGAPLGADELRIELTPKDGRWVLASDAWFFREGDARRFSAAKYGEFRVDAAGHALLVGLRGADLEPL